MRRKSYQQQIDAFRETLPDLYEKEVRNNYLKENPEASDEEVDEYFEMHTHENPNDFDNYCSDQMSLANDHFDMEETYDSMRGLL